MNLIKNNLDILTGKSSDHLVAFNQSNFLVHKKMNDDLNRLFKEALKNGFELALASSFRSYEAQKIIWNEKVSGKRVVLDSNSNPIDITSKTNEELLFLILRWSAIPGGSRHHWGTDIDIYDAKRKPLDYKLQLVPSEYESGGIFHEMSLWLTENMNKFGFFRPYAIDKGGIAPEPWHLSYRPLSEGLLKDFSFDIFKNHLLQSDFLLAKEAQKNSADIYQRYIQI